MTLCLVKSLETQETVLLSPGQTLSIGRQPQEGQTLILPYPDVSRTHAEIKWTDRGWVIVDLNSTQGTSIFGSKVKPGQEKLLKFGDCVHIGEHALVVLCLGIL